MDEELKAPAALSPPGPQAEEADALRVGLVSVVVPVYNGAGTIEELCHRLERVLSGITDRYELVLVNDGSRDNSWTVIERLANGSLCIRGINLMRNFGQHNALLCGIRAARGDIVVTIDDDLQQPPEAIPLLLGGLVDGYDVVYGKPQQEKHQLWRGVASRITKLALQSTMGVDTARKVSAFRAFRTELRSAFAAYQSPFVSIDVLLTWGTTRFSAVEVPHNPRTIGESGYTVRKLMKHALDMMTGFSTIPLQLASLIGFLFTGFGAIALLYVIAARLIYGAAVPGFAFLACLIAIFSGAQLFALGVIGEYLARMHFRLMDRPGYAVRQEIGSVAVTNERWI